MSSIRLAGITAVAVVTVGVVAGCSTGTTPAASPASPSSAASATAASPTNHAARTSHTAHPPTTSAATEPVVVDCARNGKVRPTKYVITCADANDQLTDLHWTSWDAHTATGTGQETVNDCTPTCVAGHNHTYPVDITLSDPKSWSGHTGLRFTRMTINYPGARPAQAPAAVVIQLVG